MAAATTASPVLAAVPAARRGFTLLEVMFGLALLGLGLTVLIKSAAGDIFNAQQAHMIGIVTDLARGKMYDIEEKLLHDGFSDTEQHEDDQSFSDEGWPQIHYSYKVEVVELPGFEQLQALMAGSGSARGSAGSGSGSEASGGFENSMFGGIMAQVGGLGGGGGKGSADINSSIGGAFVQSQYTMFQQVLKVTIRKVSLTVNYQVMGSDRDLKVVQFLTDAAAMDKVLNGLGSQELPAAGAGSGSGSGRGSSSGGGGTGGGGTGGGGTGGGGTGGGGTGGGGTGGGGKKP